MSVSSTVYKKRVGICYSHKPLLRCPCFLHGGSDRHSVRSDQWRKGFHVSRTWRCSELHNSLCTLVWWAMMFSVLTCRCWLMSGIYTGILAVSLWNICEPGAFPLQHPSWNKWHSHQQMLAHPTSCGCCYHSPLHSDCYQFCCQLVIYAFCIRWRWAKFLGCIFGPWQHYPNNLLGDRYFSICQYQSCRLIYGVCDSTGDYLHQFTIVLFLDLVLLGDLGAALACCSASNIFPSLCIWYVVWSHLHFSCSW